MIRVALIIPTMDGGGAEKQLTLLAGHLPRDQFHVHVFLLTRDGPRSEDLRDAGVDYTVIGKRFKADVSAVWRLRKALRSFQPDIVHTWIFAANSLGRMAALGLRRGDGRPVPIVASERCVDPWKRGWHLAIDRYLANKSAAITTNSHGVVRFYADRGIDESLFEVIPNGIEERSLSPIDDKDRHAVAADLQVDPDRHWIVAVGRLWPQKRYRDLIWAAELLGELRRDCTLLIVGDGPQRGELLRHRDAVTNVDRVRFLGHRDDVLRWLPHAAVFWIASEYEGQSNAVIEAMQCGLPVVASDIAGNRDLVVDDQTGCLVRVGDTADFARQTNALLDDPDRRRKMGDQAARRIRTRFTVDAMVDAHAELYRRLTD